MNLKCNHCGQEYTGGNEGAECSQCKLGILLEDKTVVVPRSGDDRTVREILATARPAAKGSTLGQKNKLRIEAAATENWSLASNGLGIVVFIVGLIVLVEGSVFGWVVLSVAGGLFVWGAVFKVIAQLIYIRAALEEKP